MSLKRVYKFHLFFTLLLVLSLPLSWRGEALADSSPRFALFIGTPRPVVVHHVHRVVVPPAIVIERHPGYPFHHHKGPPPWAASWDKHSKKHWKKHWKHEHRHWHHND